MTGGLAGMAKQRKVTFVQGTGKFISPNEIEVEGPDGKKIQDEAVAPNVLVGQSQEDDIDEDNPQPNKGDEPLNKALELLKAKNS